MRWSRRRLRAKLEKKKLELASANELKSLTEAELKTKEESKGPDIKSVQDKLKKEIEAASNAFPAVGDNVFNPQQQFPMAWPDTYLE